MIPSTANVAIPAGRPESRISAIPTTSAYTSPTAAASASDGTMPTVWSRSSGNRFGTTKLFCCAPSVISPARYAPSATKLMWPKEITPELPMKM